VTCALALQAGGAVSTVRTWGSTSEERALAFACDRHLSGPAEAFFRAVDVEAPASVLFRWLCQLKAAPYSYDWIDNFGRQSPRRFTPGLEELAVGQRAMTFFELVEFERDRHLTFALRSVLGRIAVTYLVLPRGDSASRLVVKLLVRHRRGPIGWTAGWLLAPLDLVMMRKSF
jgi:hypothetical protein